MLTIAHMSDQQIRMYKRHAEFKASFNILYESLKKQKPDMIVFAGDFLHEKTHISPELIEMAANHLKSLSEIAPLYLVPGNHDGNLSNLSRMDSLSPIIKAINSHRIHYLKDSGVYPVHVPGLYYDGDISLKNSKDNMLNLVVFSCFDDENQWVKNKEQIPKVHGSVIDIGIFHGMVQGAELQNGQIVQEHPYKLKNFLNVVDYLMLGDIHKMQILDNQYRAAYPGSYPQQNYSESVEKGYLLWKIESNKKHSVDFISLPNVCPFYTINLSDDLAVPLSLNFQKKARIRILSRNLTHSEKQKIQDTVSTTYCPIDIAFSEFDVLPTKVVIDDVDNTEVQDLENIETQEKLFKNFFIPYNLNEKQIDQILELNNIYDAKSKTEEDIKRNVQFKLKKMHFHNMFSFGEDNVFDFSKYKGTVGFFGKNAVGKSSLAVDIPLYIFLNKISKKGVVKNDLIINENKDNCGGSLEIELGTSKYIISRSTSVYTKNSKNKNESSVQGKTEVDFKCFNSEGIEEDKNGLERGDTDKSIRQIFGTPEDFMATSIAPQWELLGLIGAGGTKRQELIGKYFDIDIFEQKNKLAKEDLKIIKAELKLFESKNLDSEIEKNEKQLEVTLSQIDENKKLFIKIKKQLNETSKNIKLIEKKESKYIDESKMLGFSVRELDLQTLSLQKKITAMSNYPCIKNENCCLLKDLEENQNKVQELIYKKANINKQIETNNIKLKQIENENKLSAAEIEFNELEIKFDTINNQVLNLSRLEGSLQKTIEQLKLDKQKLNQIKEKYQIYDYFLLATSKDGISKFIISKNLGIINSKIKKILSAGVNFDIELVSAEEGKSIEIFFKHEKSKPRRIELCSGMEKTITAIALRAALVSVTTLPRSNIFVLDEVFSSLDPEYVDAITKMLEYLKQLFDSILIITHLDSFKDICDHSIEIARNDEGYSQILN